MAAKRKRETPTAKAKRLAAAGCCGDVPPGAGGGTDSPPAEPGFNLRDGAKKPFRVKPGAGWIVGPDADGHFRAWRVDRDGALAWNGPARTSRMVAELDAQTDVMQYVPPADAPAPDADQTQKPGKGMKMIVHATCPAGAGANEDTMTPRTRKAVRRAAAAARADAKKLEKAARRAEEKAQRKLLQHNIKRLRQGKAPIAVGSTPLGEKAHKLRKEADAAEKRAGEIARLAGTSKARK